MNGTQKRLVLEANKRALALRQAQGLGIYNPVSIYSVVENLGIEVRFTDMPSLEGMYVRQPGPLITISSHRPRGRQSFTCAHELGHHVFAHGMRMDQALGRPYAQGVADSEEFVVDCFAGLFLMPKTAVGRAFTERGWTIPSCNPDEAYRIAELFGVGYTTLITHMHVMLKLVSASHADQLQRVTPKEIQSDMLGEDVDGHVIPVDLHWQGRPIDLQVNDFVVLPDGVTVEGMCVRVEQVDETRTILSGRRPGLGRLSHPTTGWSAFVRVSRRNYVGRAMYRYLEDPDYEE